MANPFRLWPLDPASYVRHALHREERAWAESNCYIDAWIELLHAAGCEPLASLGFTLAIDFEGDQWTFFKFPLAALESFYGIDVIELTIWRPLLVHIAEQLSLGRPSLVEVDSFYLPDTAGTSYRAEHVKTSIAVQALDEERRTLGYFHNAGYFELGGDDFDGLFRLGAHQPPPGTLPPYVEVAKLGKRPPLEGESLLHESLLQLRRQVSHRQGSNPFRSYAARFAADVEWLRGQPLSTFHEYAFATLRQCGAAFELAAAHLRWLDQQRALAAPAAVAACDSIANTAKALQFATARAVHTRRAFDPAPLLDIMAAAWDNALSTLHARVCR